MDRASIQDVRGYVCRKQHTFQHTQSRSACSSKGKGCYKSSASYYPTHSLCADDFELLLAGAYLSLEVDAVERHVVPQRLFLSAPMDTTFIYRGRGGGAQSTDGRGVSFFLVVNSIERRKRNALLYVDRKYKR